MTLEGYMLAKAKREEAAADRERACLKLDLALIKERVAKLNSQVPTQEALLAACGMDANWQSKEARFMCDVANYVLTGRSRGGKEIK